MDGYCGDFAVGTDGAERGRLRVRREGMFLIFEAELGRGAEPLDLFAEGGGRQMKIGRVFAGKLKKRLSVKALAEAGLATIDGAFAVPPGADREPAGKWRPCEDPSALFSDPETAESCRGVTGALVSEAEGGVTRLAVPLEFGKPFLPLPVFSLGTWTKLGGRGYLVFALRDGRPVV